MVGSDFSDDWDDCIDNDLCPDCGGDGIDEYDNHLEVWQGPKVYANHIITCPNCGGSGRLKDCKYF